MVYCASHAHSSNNYWSVWKRCYVVEQCCFRHCCEKLGYPCILCYVATIASHTGYCALTEVFRCAHRLVTVHSWIASMLLHRFSISAQSSSTIHALTTTISFIRCLSPAFHCHRCCHYLVRFSRRLMLSLKHNMGPQMKCCLLCPQMKCCLASPSCKVPTHNSAYRCQLTFVCTNLALASC